MTREVVVGAEDRVARRAGGRPRPLERERAGHALRRLDHVEPVELLQRDGQATAIRTARRGEEDVAILEQRLAGELYGHGDVGGGERQVERARRHALEQERFVELLADLHAHLGPARAELPDDAGEDARAGRLERADADRPRLACDELVEVGLQRAEPREQAVGVPEHHLAGLGQRDGARAARALDQLQADRPLERGDLLRDRRLRVAEALGGAREGALLGDRLERGQMAGLDPDESITRHDRFQSLSVFPLLIAQADTTEGSQSVKELDMINVIFVLVAFVGLPALAWRYGVDSRAHSSWSPPSDWRERDPRS